MKECNLPMVTNKALIQEAIAAQHENIKAINKNNGIKKGDRIKYVEENKAHIKTLEGLLGTADIREIRTLDEKLADKRLDRTIALYNNHRVFGNG